MANSIPLPLGSMLDQSETRHAHGLTLAAIPLGVPARVVSLGLDEELRAWVRAVGIREGERLTVLRRAIFGGPLHVRTSSGGEFALNRQLAKAIVLRLDLDGDRDGHRDDVRQEP